MTRLLLLLSAPALATGFVVHRASSTPLLLRGVALDPRETFLAEEERPTILPADGKVIPPPTLLDGDVNNEITLDTPAESPWRTRLQLANPLSWLGPSFAALCGAVASNNVHGLGEVLPILTAMVLVGPFWEGFAQTLDELCLVEGTKTPKENTVGAYFKQTPQHPIENGDLTLPEVWQQLAVLVLGGLGLSLLLDGWQDNNLFVGLSLFAYFLNFLYSAPPIKLQKQGWKGNMAPRLTSLALPWMCGQAMLGGLDQPQDYLLPIVYCVAGLGPALLKDLSVPEPKHGNRINRRNNAAKWRVSVVQDGVQLSIALYLLAIGETLGAAALTALVLPQMFTQKSLLFSNLLENEQQAFMFSQPFMYIGMLVTSLSVGHAHPGV